MAKKKYTHTHQYQRVFIQSSTSVGIVRLAGRGREQWECALPDCSHFIPGNMPPPYGKLSLCHNCMAPFTLDVENMKQDRPICTQCAFPSGRVEFDPNDWERAEAKMTIVKNTGKEMDDITEDEITKMVQLKRILMKKV